MLTYLGLALLALVVVGVWSSCRVAGQADSIMTAWQRRALMRDRPRHLRR